jgi:hypothetical protein
MLRQPNTLAVQAAILALVTTLLSSPSLHADRIALPGFSMPSGGSSNSSGDGEKKECESQAEILKAKDSIAGHCEAAPAKGQDPGVTCPASTASGNTEKDTGGQAKYSQEGARCVVSGDTVDLTPGGHTDCSGLVSGMLAVMGKRLQPGKDITSPTTTAEMKKLLEGGSPCWKKVSDAPKAGDIFVWNNGSVGHTGMYFSSQSTWESTNSGGATGPQFKDQNGGPVNDNQGANSSRDKGVYRFDDSNTECKSQPKKIKGEDKIQSCDGIQANAN